MAAISLSKLNKHYGSLFHAVKDVDLEIADKEFVALVYSFFVEYYVTGLTGSVKG